MGLAAELDLYLAQIVLPVGQARPGIATIQGAQHCDEHFLLCHVTVMAALVCQRLRLLPRVSQALTWMPALFLRPLES